MRSIVLTLCLIMIGGTALAQFPPEIQKAQQLLSSKDYAGAIVLLEGFTAKNPQRPYPWSMLASAYDQNGDLDKASTTYQKLLEFPALKPQGLYGLASIHARRNRTAQAFAELERAVGGNLP